VANQFRLLVASLAYILMERLRALASVGTEFTRLQTSTLHAKFLKIGAVTLRNTLVLAPVCLPRRLTRAQEANPSQPGC